MLYKHRNVMAGYLYNPHYEDLELLYGFFFKKSNFPKVYKSELNKRRLGVYYLTIA